jgi:hypothetical protein
MSNTANSDIRQERQDFIIAGQPYKSAIECAERLYNNFTFRNQGAATDAFRSSLENIQDSHRWVAAFLRESSVGDIMFVFKRVSSIDKEKCLMEELMISVILLTNCCRPPASKQRSDRY